MYIQMIKGLQLFLSLIFWRINKMANTKDWIKINPEFFDTSTIFTPGTFPLLISFAQMAKQQKNKKVITTSYEMICFIGGVTKIDGRTPLKILSDLDIIDYELLDNGEIKIYLKNLSKYIK